MEPTTPNPAPTTPQTSSQGTTPAPAVAAPTTQSTTQKLWGPQATTPTTATQAPQAQVSVPSTVPTAATPQAVQPQATAPVATPTVQPGVVQMTPELLTQAVAAAVKAGQPVVPPPTPTQEEFEKMFNVVKPTKDQWVALRGDNEEQALAALTQMLQGAVKQASTIASYQMASELEEMRKQFNPALTYAQEKETEKLKEEFTMTYPDLKGMDPLLYTIRDQFILQKRTFPNKEAAFKAVAETARGMLQNIPALSNGQPAGGAGTPATTATTPTMPTLSGRGTSGAGAGEVSNPKVSTTKRIFGPQS